GLWGAWCARGPLRSAPRALRPVSGPAAPPQWSGRGQPLTPVMRRESWVSTSRIDRGLDRTPSRSLTEFPLGGIVPGAHSPPGEVMQYVRLGRTGLPVSRLCLGTMTFGLQCDEPSSRAILDRAAAGRITVLDTSDVYPVGGNLET